MADKNKNKNSGEELLDEALNNELEIKETIDEVGKIDEISGASGQDEETGHKFFYVKLRLLKIQEEVKQILKYLDKEAVEENFTIEPALQEKLKLKQSECEEGQKIIEGVFDGKEMIGPDNKRYSVPSNYASKSQLVEGDIMKLIIKQDGTFIYKQISPIERDRLIGLLIKNEADSQFYAMVDSQRWQLLTASVTFFKGEAGDEVVILVPKGARSKWAAVENIVRKS